MGVINVKIPDETETEFRLELLRRFKPKKGIMGEAIDMALKNWIYAPTVWVGDIPVQNVSCYIETMAKENQKLTYFQGNPLNDKREGYVGMYYKLRDDVSP